MRLLRLVTTAACAALSLGCQGIMASPAAQPSTTATVVPLGSTDHPRDELHALLLGRWRGALLYKDYRDSTKRVTLPTVLDVTSPSHEPGVALHFVYDDGPGKTVVEDDRFVSDAEVRSVTWRSGTDHVQAYAASMAAGTRSRPRTVVLEGTGRDDNRPAALRETIVVDDGTLRILKEVRFADRWEFRHEYRFTRDR